MTALPLILTGFKIPPINIIIRRATAIRELTISMMAEATEKKNKEAVVEEEARERRKELPVAPEKPEPGDRCGSGCVRCVWDVYYDELDAYDRAVKEYHESMIGSEAKPDK